jgi:hypothetical protein
MTPCHYGPLHAALRALLAAPTWTATFAVLRANADLLLTDAAQRTLAHAALPGTDTDLWQAHAQLLATARARGIPQASADLLRQIARARHDELTRVFGAPTTGGHP